MFKKTGIFTIAILASFLAVGSFATALAGETLNLVFLANTNDEEYDAALTLKNYVESRTDNIIIEIFPGPQLCGGPRECFESLDAQVVDIYVATAGGLSVVYPEASALNLPYLFTSDEVVNELMSGPYAQTLREQVYKGTKGKFLLMNFSNTGGWRNYANAKHAIKTPDDLKGMKMRTVEDQVQMEQVRLHGASPTPIPFMEVYTSLQTGVVDGTLNSISDLTNAKLHEKARYMTLDGHNFMFCLWMMNTDRFVALPESDRDIIISGFEVMGKVQNGVQIRRELDNWESFAKEKGEVYNPTAEEREAFATAVAPVRDSYLRDYKENGKEFLSALDSAITDAEAIIAKRHSYLKNPK